jgi:PAS domain S-box-containing protein
MLREGKAGKQRCLGVTAITVPLPRRGTPPYGLAVMRVLIASLPAAVAYLSGPDLVIDFANDACFELVGDRDLIGRPLCEALPELAEQGEVEILTRIMETGEPVRGSEARVRIHRHGHAEQRFVDYVYQPVPGAGGDVAGVLLYAADVTAHVKDRHELEELAARLAAAEERLRALFESMPTGVVHYGADGTVLGANPAARHLLGLSEAEMTGWPLPTVRQAVHEDGTRFRAEDLPVRLALRTGEMVCDVLMGVPHGRTGELRWLLATAVPVARDSQGRPQRAYVMFSDVTEQRQVEAAIARERAARAEASSARERLTFLLRAGALVAATHDQDELLDQVTQLVVPSLADYCVVFLPTADGDLRASALTHADPVLARKLAALREYPIPAAGPLMSQIAYTTGSTHLARDVASELPAWAAAAPEVTEIIASMRPHSALAAPLQAGQRTLGVMVFGRGPDRPRFATSDTEVVEEIARRLAVGLANANTFAREHAIAETLQRSILPDTLPRIPGLDLAVRYLPATEGANVGGDWYDAFGVGGGRIALVTGDVAGHTIASASIMGQLRSVLRAYAIDNPDPGRVLRQTNTALVRLLPQALASVVYAVLDLGTGELMYANAGHPPPVLVAADGQAEYLGDTAGIMLGACADTEFTVGTRRLSPGTALLCYTDGLIEHRHRDISEGLALLGETLRRCARLSAEQICASAQAAMLGTAERADDVCLLAARLTARQSPPLVRHKYRAP